MTEALKELLERVHSPGAMRDWRHEAKPKFGGEHVKSDLSSLATEVGRLEMAVNQGRAEAVAKRLASVLETLSSFVYEAVDEEQLPGSLYKVYDLLNKAAKAAKGA